MNKVKVILVGNERVGKSSLAFYLCNGNGNPNYNRTIGIDLCINYLNISNDKIQLHVFDSTGSERYRHILEIYIKTTKVVILVYSVTDRQSFIDLEYWIESINKINPSLLKDLIIIGNKIDQGPFREISYDDGKKFADKYKATFFECSAIEGTNVNLAFRTAVEKVIGHEAKIMNKIEESGDNVEFSIFNDDNNVSCWFNLWDTLKYMIKNH